MNSIQSQSKTSYKVQNPHSTRSSLDRVARQLHLLETSSPKHTLPTRARLIEVFLGTSPRCPNQTPTAPALHVSCLCPTFPNQTPDEALAPSLIAAAAAPSPHDRIDPSLALAFLHARLSVLH